MLITLVVFVVSMLLWGVAIVSDPPAPWNRAAALCAWIAVFSLFLLAHGLRV